MDSVLRFRWRLFFLFTLKNDYFYSAGTGTGDWRGPFDSSMLLGVHWRTSRFISLAGNVLDEVIMYFPIGSYRSFSLPIEDVYEIIFIRSTRDRLKLVVLTPTIVSIWLTKVKHRDRSILVPDLSLARSSSRRPWLAWYAAQTIPSLFMEKTSMPSGEMTLRN